MNEKFKLFFTKAGLYMSAVFIFLLGMFFGKHFQNKRIGTESDFGRNEKFDENCERAEQSALTISEIISRVKERGGKSEEENTDV